MVPLSSGASLLLFWEKTLQKGQILVQSFGTLLSINTKILKLPKSYVHTRRNSLPQNIFNDFCTVLLNSYLKPRHSTFRISSKINSYSKDLLLLLHQLFNYVFSLLFLLLIFIFKLIVTPQRSFFFLFLILFEFFTFHQLLDCFSGFVFGARRQSCICYCFVGFDSPKFVG